AAGAVDDLLGQQSPHGVGDFLTAAVSDRNVDVETALVGGGGTFHRASKSTRGLFADQLQVPDRPHAPAVGRRADLFDDVGDDLDERGQLGRITAQVFGGKQVDSGHFDAGLLAPAQHRGDLDPVHPVPVADVVVAGVACPAPVTVAQHGDVTRQRGFRCGQSLPQPQFVEPV